MKRKLSVKFHWTVQICLNVWQTFIFMFVYSRELINHHFLIFKKMRAWDEIKIKLDLTAGWHFLKPQCLKKVKNFTIQPIFINYKFKVNKLNIIFNRIVHLFVGFCLSLSLSLTDKLWNQIKEKRLWINNLQQWYSSWPLIMFKFLAILVILAYVSPAHSIKVIYIHFFTFTKLEK